MKYRGQLLGKSFEIFGRLQEHATMFKWIIILIVYNIENNGRPLFQPQIIKK